MKPALIIRTLALVWAYVLIMVSLATAVVFPQHDPEIIADAWRPIAAALALALLAHLVVVHFRKAAR